MKWIFLVLLLSVSCSGETPAQKFAKFKPGDCIAITDDLDMSQYEFLQPDVTVKKILKVGKRNYLYSYRPYEAMQSEFEIESIDDTHTKVMCPNE